MSCDICEIKNLIYQYAHSLDDGDLDAVADLFRHGSIVGVASDGSEAVNTGVDAVREMYQRFTRLYPDTGTPHTLHHTSNVVVKVDDSGERASARSYAVVFQSLEDFPMQPIIGVRYEDSFHKVENCWFFDRRRIDSRLFGDLSRHLLQAM